jgi:predicted secreted protein
LKGKTTCIILAVGAVFMLTLGQVTAQPGPGMMTVSEEDNGRLVGIGLHDRLVVRLGAQLGTGFSWAPAPPESGNLRLVDQRAEVRPQAAPGASEIQVFTFEPVALGSAQLRFVYRQPWSGGEDAARRFSLDVSVR